MLYFGFAEQFCLNNNLTLGQWMRFTLYTLHSGSPFKTKVTLYVTEIC